MTSTQAFRNALHVPTNDPAAGRTVTVVTPGDEYTAAWQIAGGVPEAPLDAQLYGRQSETWQPILPQAASVILDSIKTVDGIGSGLDADLLDGLDGAYYLNWANITNKPSTFTPSSHSHPQAEVTDLVTDLAGKAPIVHTHAQADVTGLTADLASKLPLAGGTMTGLLTLKASDATAPLNMPQGVTPSSPNNGDVWLNNTVMTIRANGTTYATAYLNGTSTFNGAKTFSVKPVMTTPSASTASVNLPLGVAPTTPVDGDMWATSAGLYVRISGVTVGPLAASGAADWSAITGKPATFPPDVHTHTAAQITDLTTAVAAYVDPRIMWSGSGVLIQNNVGDDMMSLGTNSHTLYADNLYVQPRDTSVATYNVFYQRDKTGVNRGSMVSYFTAATGEVRLQTRTDTGAVDASFTVKPAGSTIDTPLTIVGEVASGGTFRGTGTNIYLGNTGAGNIHLRPSGTASNAGQLRILATTGDTEIGGDLTVASGIIATAGSVYSYAANGVFGHNSASGSGTVSCVICAGSSGNINIRKTGSANQTNINFINKIDTTNTTVGTIQTSGSTTAYNTTSDKALKNFVGNYDPAEAIAIIRADPVKSFTWKSSGDEAVGWFAQDSYAVSPDLASPPAEWQFDPDTPEIKMEPKPGDPGYQPWGIDYGRRTPYLWAALSAALDKIDQLEARLAALEGA